MTQQLSHFRLSKLYKIILRGVVPSTAIATLSSCIQTSALKPEFSFQVSPGNAAGAYVVSGKTNLPAPSKQNKNPDASTVIIQAIRILRPSPQAKQLSNNEPIQVVVARQQATIANGTWQANLNLYGGANLESWQQNQALSLNGFEPDQQLTFIATTLPLDPNLKLDTPKPESTPDPATPLKITESGRYYLKAEQSASIAPPPAPNGSTAGNRQLIKVNANPLKGEPPVTKANGAPLSPKEYMR
jgi:hypothetical protein